MVFKHVLHFYEKYERPISSLSLLTGFIFDALTVTRVDLFLDNVLLGVRFTVAIAGILILNWYENKMKVTVGRFHFWMQVIIQFAIGGLFGSFVVYYFRSGSIAVAWPFVLLLMAVFLCNEFLRHHYSRLTFQITILYVAIYSFSIFFIPILLHRIGAGVFLISAGASLLIIATFIFLLSVIAHEKFVKSRLPLFASIVGITLIINILYFTDLIPPIPLSLNDGGAYHSIMRNSDGNYTVEVEPHDWTFFFRRYPLIHVEEGSSVSVFSAIFSPTSFSLDIYHQWQYYDQKQSGWVTKARIPLRIVGGRGDGFRTYSRYSATEEGKWRVNVQTDTGQVIGRINFKVVSTNVEPAVIKEIK